MTCWGRAWVQYLAQQHFKTRDSSFAGLGLGLVPRHANKGCLGARSKFSVQVLLFATSVPPTSAKEAETDVLVRDVQAHIGRI